jgi:hypothetical protein
LLLLLHFSQAITLADNQPLKVTLGEATEVLDEVVVTALGIKRSKKMLSYNVQPMKEDEITTVKDANFINSLNGKSCRCQYSEKHFRCRRRYISVMHGNKSIGGDNNVLQYDKVAIRQLSICEPISRLESLAKYARKLSMPSTTYQSETRQKQCKQTIPDWTKQPKNR